MEIFGSKNIVKAGGDQIKIFTPARTMPFRGYENPLYTQCVSTIAHKYGE